MNDRSFLPINALSVLGIVLFLPIHGAQCAQLSAAEQAHETTRESVNYGPRLHRIITVVRQLISNGDLPCAPTLSKDSLLKQLTQLESKCIAGSNRTVTQYEIARTLENFVYQNNIATGEAQTTLAEDTEHIIRRLEEYLAQRGTSPAQKIIRSCVEKVSPYKAPLMIAALPITVYGLYTLEQRMGAPFQKDPALKKSWDTFHKMVIGAFVGAGYAYAQDGGPKELLAQAIDTGKGWLAYIQGQPFRNSNPASSSKVSLQDIPARAATKEQLKTLAQRMVNKEAIVRMAGALNTGILAVGDAGLAEQLAQGLAHELTAQAKAFNKNYRCPVAVIHVSKLMEEPLKKKLEKIKHYNSSGCVVLIQDLEWLNQMNEEARAKVTADLFEGIASLACGRQFEPFAVVVAAKDCSSLDPLLLQPKLFGIRVSLNLSEEELNAACIHRIEKLFNTPIESGALRAQLRAALIEHGFNNVVTMLHRAYTDALPLIGTDSFTEQTIAHTLEAGATINC